MCFATSSTPDRHEQRLDGTLLGHPAPDTHLYRLGNPRVVGPSSDNNDPKVGPLIAQLTPHCQPVLTSEVKVERYNVNLVVQEQFQGLRGRTSGPDDLEVGFIGKPARQGFGKDPMVIYNRHANSLLLHRSSLSV